jgi:hypothetical protein
MVLRKTLHYICLYSLVELNYKQGICIPNSKFSCFEHDLYYFQYYERVISHLEFVSVRCVLASKRYFYSNVVNKPMTLFTNKSRIYCNKKGFSIPNAGRCLNEECKL